MNNINVVALNIDSEVCSCSSRVTALHTPAWSGHPALWAQRAEGRRSSTTTTSPSAPSSRRISTPSRSSWLTRIRQLRSSPGSPSFWLWRLLKKWIMVQYEVWNIREAQTFRPPTNHSMCVACLCMPYIPIGFSTMYSLLPLFMTAVCTITALIPHSALIQHFCIHYVIFVCKNRLNMENCALSVQESHLRQHCITAG